MTNKQSLFIGKISIDAHGTTIEYMSNGLAFRDTKVSVVTVDNSLGHLTNRMSNFLVKNLLEPNSATCRYLDDEQQQGLMKTASELAAFDPKTLDLKIVRYAFTGLSVEWSIVPLEEQFDLVLL